MTQLEWYVVRASGMVGFGLLTLAVVLGLALSGRVSLPHWPRFAVEDVHRFVGLLTGTFVVVHIFTLFVDSYLPFSLTQLLVPGTSSYRPFATALGVVAAELLLALAITNHYKQRLSYRFWRQAHYVNFAVWALALVHGILSGTDRGAVWATLLYIAAGAVVAGLIAWRALNARATARTGGAATREAVPPTARAR
jgi:sulfoxide reductase heme-binding subunit YedZ